jgi:hypothetical protein
MMPWGTRVVRVACEERGVRRRRECASLVETMEQTESMSIRRVATTSWNGMYGNDRRAHCAAGNAVKIGEHARGIAWRV